MMAKQRGVIAYMLKTAGANFFQGKSIMNISFPINISDYRSVVENFSYSARNHGAFLEKAADATNIERMKLVLIIINTI